MRFLLSALLLLLLLSGACSPDTEDPQMDVVFPREGDTLDPGSHVLKVWARDNRRMWGVEFWEGGEMLGIDMHSRDDTWRMGWDCRNDTQRAYILTVNADDYADNWLTRHVRFFVRR